ncbi:MAG: hypothetical protein EON55_01495 [Alphaproteobacteria bacterium]|nr:MAG: hypothetical protein EON55_01495 [Alphaproteobacteria bacterium]
MSNEPSHVVGRAETKAVKAAEKADAAGAAWADVNAQVQAREDKTARLRAARLAQAEMVSADIEEAVIKAPSSSVSKEPGRRIHRKKLTA